MDFFFCFLTDASSLEDGGLTDSKGKGNKVDSIISDYFGLVQNAFATTVAPILFFRQTIKYLNDAFIHFLATRLLAEEPLILNNVVFSFLFLNYFDRWLFKKTHTHTHKNRGTGKR